ncbi:hypothetical protein [Paenibacillus sp. R14(2021)]|uniref:hypothetical protein n=1 Tax=Paenibacillus sp. R14(2021) TaxID=2859228 RepID=UPI001C613A15|nr:hypothetical protein [Paenibacillus sp. R14(2021)]
MIKKEFDAQATFDAQISRLVPTCTRRKAIDMAAFELNKDNVHLDRLKLQNDMGESVTFSVQQVEALEWFDAEFTECCNQFRVFGRIRLSISLLQAARSIIEAEPVPYKLPLTTVYDKPILVISEGVNHIFLTVWQQEMEWKSTRHTMNPFIRLA